MIETLGIISSAIAPLFNIPLILRLRKRRSSDDVSEIWAIGVLISAILMLPAGLLSESAAFKVFCATNLLLFSVVVAHVFWYRRNRSCKSSL